MLSRQMSVLRRSKMRHKTERHRWRWRPKRRPDAFVEDKVEETKNAIALNQWQLQFSLKPVIIVCLITSLITAPVAEMSAQVRTASDQRAPTDESSNKIINIDRQARSTQSPSSNEKPFASPRTLSQQQQQRRANYHTPAVSTAHLSGQASAGEQVAEGLTLSSPSSSSHQHAGTSGGGGPDWPLAQLDRIKSENRLVAVAGQNVVLNCAVQFKDNVERPFVVNWLKYPNKLPIYIWYAGYPPHVAAHYENRVQRIGQASLNLSQVKEQDQGLYECKIYHLHRAPDDKGTSTWIFLDVQAPPRFTRTPPPVNYVQSGDSLHLTCAAQSSPAPLVRWYKDKTPITSDTGAYRLSSSSFESAASSGSLESAPEVGVAAISAQVTQTATTTTTTTPITAGSDEHSMHVDASAGNFTTSRTSSSSSSLDAYAFGAPTVAQLDLFIDNVQAGQATGDYSCLASNSEGSIGTKTQVLVAVPAVIVSVPKDQTRQEGERVEMVCQAKAIPSNITYRWLFNEKPIGGLKWFESRYSIKRDGTLVLNSIHRDDEGDYKCQATNGVAHRNQIANVAQSASAKSSTGVDGQQVQQKPHRTSAPIYAEASARLTVEYPARITYSPAIQYLPLGLSGVIKCFVAAAPPLEFLTWTLNNQQFDPNIDPNVERLHNGSLLIHQVSKRYEGKYRCTPFNKHGSAGSSAAMDVRVERPPQFELKPAEFYKANVNSKVEIPCSASGSPAPTVTWRRVLHSMQAPRPATTGGETESAGQTGSGSEAATPSRRSSSASSMMSDSDDEQSDEMADLHLRQSHAGSVQSDDSPSANGGGGGGQPAGNNNDQQPTVITEYAKLPSDRAEYRNDQLQMHSLRKEDHGRYECVIENEIATLVASTQLYIEETTPHAPMDPKVEPKVWSAKVSWQPGYDGGFEQSFVVWYRQVDESASKRRRPSATNVIDQTNGVRTRPETSAVDLNWHSLSVPLGHSNEILVENLTQDTTYEFYVRAKNIIGDGPRTQIVQATTKRAVSPAASVAPNEAMDPMASTVLTDDQTLAATLPASGFGVGGSNDDDEAETGGSISTINPSVLGIIHLVDVTTTTPTTTTEEAASASTSGATDDSGAPANESSSKVIRIYFPAKSSSGAPSSTGAPGGSGVAAATSPNKREDESSQTELARHSNSGSNNKAANSSNDQSQALRANEPPADMSTAPRNVSMTKVAQGWVLGWEPAERAPSEPMAGELVAAAAAPPTGSLSLTAAASRSQLSSSAPASDVVASAQLRNQSPPQVTYVAEFKERGSAWHTLASSGRERSLLVKDLKPGAEYSFRVYAQSALSGARGSPSAEFRYQIADNRRKPGSTQALSAGVVSGVLFFIACIVIAVCGVNMCNKRRKKRAEKAAYVMMACPVLESHTDIAALNSNSLVKNGRGFECASKDRIPSVSHRANLSVFAAKNNNNNNNGRSNGKNKLLEQCVALAAKSLAGSASSKSRGERQMSQSTCMTKETRKNDAGREQTQHNGSNGIGISYSTNAPLPIDVVDADLDLDDIGASVCVATTADSTTSGHRHRHCIDSMRAGVDVLDQADVDVDVERETELDHYWRRQPSDRKWGTLTVAGARLAERRAIAMSASQSSVANAATLAAMRTTTTTTTDWTHQPDCNRLAQLAWQSGQTTTTAATTAIRSVIDKPETHCQFGADQRRTTQTLPHSFCSVGPQQFSPNKQFSRLARDLSHLRESHSNSLKLQRPNDTSSAKSDSLAGEARSRRLRLAQQRFNEWLKVQRNRLKSRQEPTAAAVAAAPSSASASSARFAAPTSGSSARPLEPTIIAHGSYRRRRRAAANGSAGAVVQSSSLASNHHHQSFTGVSSAASLAPVSNGNGNDDDEVFPPPLRPTTALLGRQNQHHRRACSSLAAFRRSCSISDSPAANNRVTRNMHAIGPEVESSKTNETCVALSCNSSMQFQSRPLQCIRVNTNNDSDADADNSLGGPNAVACLNGIKRNSFARNTLPMAYGVASFACTQESSSIASRPLPMPPSGFEDYFRLDATTKDPLVFEAATLVIDPTTPAQADSGLFVRALSDQSVRGLPQPGQRREQRRLALLSDSCAEFAQVQRIGSDEKIETYLRHYERQRPTRAAPPPPPPMRSTATAASGLRRQSDDSVELDQVEEVTFQPYYNLPALKYTIQLPLRRTRSGRMLFDETAHLRCVRRPTDKRRLGSSSSCPARSNHVDASDTALDSTMTPPPPPPRMRSCLRRSLDSSIDRPTVANRPVNAHEPHLADSLEETTPVGEYATVAELADKLEAQPPMQPPGSSSSSSSSTSSSSNANGSGSSSAESPATSLACFDQSVDENYEFDQLSSCSSSQQVRRRCNVESVQEGHSYASVDKSHKTRPQGGNVVDVQRSRFYDFSKQKKQILPTQTTRKSHDNDIDQPILS